MPLQFLRSKVSRRILILFVLCALLPLSILAVVSFYEVSSQLRAESQKQLAQASKNHGMEIYDRLEMLDSDLQVVGLRWKERRSLATDNALQPHFSRITVYGPDGREIEHRGGAMEFLPLAEKEESHLRDANPLIRIHTCADASRQCVWMMRVLQGEAQDAVRIEAELNPQDLWPVQGIQNGLNLTVLSDTGAVLFATDERAKAGADKVPPFRHASGYVDWRSGDEAYDGAYWKLLVKPRFLENSWTILVSQDHAQVVAPMLEFRKSFPLVMLLSFWIVLLFSAMQVRQTMGPLEELTKGTREIAAQRFESRVAVHSGDEFEALGESFNLMAEHLGRQFGTLKAINEVNRAIHASLDGEAIVDGVLMHMPRLIASEWFGVCVFDDARKSGWTRFRKADVEHITTEPTAINATDWLELQNNPEGFVVGPGRRTPEYVVPMQRVGVKVFMILPIRVENSIRAALIAGNASGVGLANEQLQEALPVADQLAVALSHVRLINALEQLHFGTLTALARAIDAKSDWTAGHSERVTNMALEIAKKMGLGSRDLQIIQMGGLLHDVGKIGTPPEILDKPGKLTPEEMRIMQDHVRIGVRILEPIPGLKEALPLVAEHHEWFNGGGYPSGLAGEQISLYARILAVADCYDALTSDRPYRKGLPVLEVGAMLQQKSGVQFDPQVIAAFSQIVADTMQRKSAVFAGQGV